MPEAPHDTRPTILVVDDSPENLLVLHTILDGPYRVLAATNGERALQIATQALVPDLILLDIIMPGMDGYEVCHRLKTDTRTARIPVIFLTALAETEDEEKGFGLGAEDYITKPVRPAIVRARIKTHLLLKVVRDSLQDKSDFLEQEVTRRTHEIGRIQDVTMVALGSLAETRDNETGGHIRRTQLYMQALTAKLRRKTEFARFLTDETIELLYKSAPLHDIGKVGIPDHILLKPGPLSLEEFAIMKRHTTLGYEAIVAAEKQLDSPNSFLRIARELAWTHHEKWDGSGYPRGLAGRDIPLSGRLMAIIDVYDALVSRRVYKPAFSHEQALATIEQGMDLYFDADIVRCMLEIQGQFRLIAQEHADRGMLFSPVPPPLAG